MILVKNLKDKLTGNLVFSLTLTSVTDGVATGNFDYASVTIRDKDHPLSHLFGTWKGTISSAESGKLPMNVIIEPVEGDDTYKKLVLSHIWCR